MYYSDVRFVTTPRGYALLVDMAEYGTMTDVVLEGLKDLLESANIAEYHEEQKYILLGWNDIQWDGEGEREQAFYKALKELENRGITYKFLRVGELQEDVEERWNWGRPYILPDLCIVRTIRVWPDDEPRQSLLCLKNINSADYQKFLLKSAAGFNESA